MKVPIARPTTWVAIVLRVVVVVWLSAAAVGMIFEDLELGDTSGRRFTAFVFVLFGWGIVETCIGLFEVLRVRAQLKRLRAEFHRKGLAEVLAKLEGVANPFIAVIRGLFEQHRVCRAAVDAEPLLSVLESRLSRRVERLVRLGSLVMMVGFAGTAFGLSMMLNGLSAAVALSDGDGALLMQMLFLEGGPMAALGGAYGSTLAAIVCGGVVLRFLAHALQSSIERMCDQFRELLAIYVTPRLRSGGEGRRSVA